LSLSSRGLCGLQDDQGPPPPHGFTLDLNTQRKPPEIWTEKDLLCPLHHREEEEKKKKKRVVFPLRPELKERLADSPGKKEEENTKRRFMKRGEEEQARRPADFHLYVG